MPVPTLLQLLDEACVELGVNYPYPVVEVQESRALLDSANKVVKAALKIVKTPASARGPYRPPTLNPADPDAPAELKYVLLCVTESNFSS
jgi:hypothetical protein